ncbi:hypothetical protein [Leptospira jelokensis]|uniref:Uncharacterized protein n=1 Tax=Leptospira jelokensis TaxID=2484931 RepID=A0A4Z0ZXS5_9LEPT|nr:hypothetical protein [Leptospira jelokensis]TGL76893.1 hypothetical protein EHQ62_00375 [Leptospira jelokensis]
MKGKFYLDTSVVRADINRLMELSKSTSIHVSAYNIVELLSQLSEKTFTTLAPIFRKIDQSYIKLDYRLPEDIIAKSYNLKYRFSKKKLIGSFFKKVTISNSYQSFLEGISKVDYQSMLLYDRLFYPPSDSIQKNELLDIRKAFQREYGMSYKSTLFKKELLSEEFFRIFLRRIRKSLLFYILGRLTKTNKSLETIEETLNSYNGKIDCFLHGFSDYFAVKYSQQNFIGRNDYSDLLHLVYLGNLDSKISFIYRDDLYRKLRFELSEKMVHAQDVF